MSGNTKIDVAGAAGKVVAGDLLKALNARIAATQADLTRIQVQADRETTELQARISLLTRARNALSTDKENWVLDLVESGVLDSK